MEKINNRQELIEAFKDAIAVEETAKKEYNQDSKGFSDPKIKEVYNRIMTEEEKHIALLKSLIIMLENN